MIRSIGRFTKSLFDKVRQALHSKPQAQARRIETKLTPTMSGAKLGKKKENVSRHQWAHGATVRYSDRSYYVDHDGRFLRLKPGESVGVRLHRLAQ